MTLEELQTIFNRAIYGSFGKGKMLLTFVILLLCGVLAVFFRGVAVAAGPWLALSLTFIPIFLCAGVLFSLGILLIRAYHDEIKAGSASYRQIMGKSWDVVIGSSYISVPIVLCYLLLWMLLGLFVLLSEIPTVGAVFSVLLAFAPFLINLSSIVLILLNLALLFYAAPILALKGFNQIRVSRILYSRFKKDVFSNVLLITISLAPLTVLLVILSVALMMTHALCTACSTPTQTVLTWFVTMIPFTAALTPAVVFFFNFSAESHVLMMKKHRA